MTTVSELLAAKRQRVPICVRATATVLEALELMRDKKVSALAIVEDPRTLVGLFTERDCARRVALAEKGIRETRIAEAMTPAERVYFVRPDNTVDECMVLMTAKEVRHLPVLDGTRFVGIASLGDVLRSLIAEKETMIDKLTERLAPR